jgi:hypothetical protein
MGYDIHITRAEEWSESETTPITLEEWIAHARSDPALRVDVIDGRADSTLPDGQVLSIKVKGLVAWFGKGAEPSRQPLAWFSWSEGSIDARNPDTATLRKMHEIAKALNARVQGDEGELYNADGQPQASRDPNAK